MHLAKIDVPLYIRNKRFSKKSNWIRRIKKSRLRSSDRASVIKFQGDFSKIVDLVAKNCCAGTRKPVGKIAYFKAPRIFSILTNPEESLKALGAFAAQCNNNNKIETIQIDFSAVKEMDLSANAILDVLVQEIDTYRKLKRKKIHWQGAYPSSPALKRFVKAIGVIKFLDVKHEKVKHLEAQRLRVFEKRSKYYVRQARPHISSFMNIATADFANHIDSCLKEIKKKLSNRGRRDLTKYVGEILDNAEQHSGMHDWTIQGYLDMHAEDMVCEIVIFNFGKSIFDSFNALTKDDYTFGRIVPYVLRHSSLLYTGQLSRSDLFTLIALQQSVSTKNVDENTRRGNGTYDLIRFFDLMYQACSRDCPDSHKTQPVMKLLSGTSQILFDGQHKMVINPMTDLGEIAFNKSNDLTKRPDPTFVNGFKGTSFPGTCLSIKFPLPSQGSVVVSDH